MQFLPHAYFLCLYDIVHIEKPDGICSLIFVADEFSAFFTSVNLYY